MLPKQAGTSQCEGRDRPHSSARQQSKEEGGEADKLREAAEASAKAAAELLQEEQAAAQSAQRTKLRAATKKARQKQRKQVRQVAAACKPSPGRMHALADSPKLYSNGSCALLMHSSLVPSHAPQPHI